MWRTVKLAFFFWGLQVINSEFFKCHDDPRNDPDEGTAEEMEFTWLGTLQYVHVKKGNPHYFRAPRVVLISQQFVLSTALDAVKVPEGYAFFSSDETDKCQVLQEMMSNSRGNIVFGEYERDEVECGITPELLAEGARCEGAALLVPLADVLVHPEYPKVPHSIALLKLLTPIRSSYMLPVCLPFKNFIINRNTTISQLIFHIDFVNAVPRDVLEEEKEVYRLLVLPKDLCRRYSVPEFRRGTEKNRVMCTNGCGLHSGAPSLVHEHTGHWSVVALSQGWSPCTDPLRSSNGVPPPPQHTLLYPYVPWITAALTGRSVEGFSRDDPFGYIMPRDITRRRFEDDVITPEEFGTKVTWTGHWWLAGLRCFDRGEAAEDIYKFYHEIFQINPGEYTRLDYYLELNTGTKAKVVCIKVGVPYKAGNPVAWEVDTSKAKLRIPVLGFVGIYRFQVEAWAANFSSDFDAYNEESDTVGGFSAENISREEYFSWELTTPGPISLVTFSTTTKKDPKG